MFNIVQAHGQYSINVDSSLFLEPAPKSALKSLRNGIESSRYKEKLVGIYQLFLIIEKKKLPNKMPVSPNHNE